MSADTADKLPFSAAILAGGQSLRMGRDKAMLEIDGVPIIQHIANTLSGIFPELFIIANEGEKYTQMGFSVTPDIYPGNNSLGGLYTAVSIMKSSHVFVAGCDMPLLQPGLISAIGSMVDNSDVIIPVRDDYPEPLCAFYGKKCEPCIETSISSGNLKMTGFHSEVRVKRIEEATWRSWDPGGLSFLNANTPEDFETITALAGDMG